MKHKGITLIELIVVMAIMAIFSLGVYNFSSAQFNIYKMQSTQTQLQYDAKNVANQIASDIKRSRLTPYSVETNHKVKDVSTGLDVDNLSYGKFKTISDSLEESDKPLVYIDQIGDKSCVYVWKTSSKQLIKIDLDSNEFTLDRSNGGIIQKKQIPNYDEKNYANVNEFNNDKKKEIIEGLTDKPLGMSDTTVLHMYEEYGIYYLICEEGISGSPIYYQYTLLPRSDRIIKNTEKVIANNVVDAKVTSVDLNSDYDTLPDDTLSNAFNITIVLEKDGKKRSFTTCASRELYDGGDTNENSN